ncbi:RNA-binding (RRM/RBD/RNP motifs) family protein [Striga asiatica]|uniref:RNA-binding (RRM/RBD/RNP motifs) family protein n=1 Tax=Striga asiatica TaxID=4170 RepID=A0A5A7QF18_STRAF|nr:RNA-binding (RRM/RBD/RNP motifs) family protein [Striga asiatica]
MSVHMFVGGLNFSCFKNQEHMANTKPHVEANAFVQRYYSTLSKFPQHIHKFYGESSLLSWPGSDGDSAPATTLSVRTEGDVSDCPKSLPAEKAKDQVENVKNALDVSVAKSSPNSPIVSEPALNLKTLPGVSYASMVAKSAPVILPKAATPKSTTPKPAVVNSVAPNASTTIVSKSPTGSKSTPQANPQLEGRGVFVGGLPYEITEQGLRDALKQFGPIRTYPNSVQIKKHNVCLFRFHLKMVFVLHLLNSNLPILLVELSRFIMSNLVKRKPILHTGSRPLTVVVQGPLQGLGLEMAMETSPVMIRVGPRALNRPDRLVMGQGRLIETYQIDI